MNSVIRAAHELKEHFYRTGYYKWKYTHSEKARQRYLDGLVENVVVEPKYGKCVTGKDITPHIWVTIKDSDYDEIPFNCTVKYGEFEVFTTKKYKV